MNDFLYFGVWRLEKAFLNWKGVTSNFLKHKFTKFLAQDHKLNFACDLVLKT
jgi:hypothetical protein